MTKNEFIEKHGEEKYKAHIAKMREANRKRYHEDPEYKKRQDDRIKDKLKNDPEFREKWYSRVAKRFKERYKTDPEFHARVNQYSKMSYHRKKKGAEK